MHYTHTVALPGDIAPEDLRTRLDMAMAKFDENLEVPLHRDTSAYAEDFETQYVKAVAFAIKQGDDWTVRTREQLVEEWNGNDQFDTDGWPLTTSNPDGRWDWWVVGGRWGGAWVLREGAESGPLVTENHAFGRSPDADSKGGRTTTDNARLNAIEFESITSTYSWLDLDGAWTTKWIGPTREEATDGSFPKDTSHWTAKQEQHEKSFMKFIQDLPRDAWLVQIDYHN